jgi:hypothetical protein
MLDPPDIRAILAAGEGRRVEFKEGLAGDGRIARTLCAFANTAGGIVLVGVDDRGRVRGAARPDALVVRLRQAAATLVAPPVAVRAGVARLSAKPVVWCSVPLSPARPHAARSTDGVEVLVRIGASNRRAAPAALAAIRPAPRGPLSDLDREILAAAASGGASVTAFARARSIGKQRARQAFERLERAGLLIAHGLAEDRRYETA